MYTASRIIGAYSGNYLLKRLKYMGRKEVDHDDVHSLTALICWIVPSMEIMDGKIPNFFSNMKTVVRHYRDENGTGSIMAENESLGKGSHKW